MFNKWQTKSCFLDRKIEFQLSSKISWTSVRSTESYVLKRTDKKTWLQINIYNASIIEIDYAELTYKIPRVLGLEYVHCITCRGERPHKIGSSRYDTKLILVTFLEIWGMSRVPHHFPLTFSPLLTYWQDFLVNSRCQIVIFENYLTEIHETISSSSYRASSTDNCLQFIYTRNSYFRFQLRFELIPMRKAKTLAIGKK